MKLSDQVIDQRVAELEGWTRKDQKWLEKKYRFKVFLTGIAFVEGVAQISEGMNHHPMIVIEYKMVTLRLTSWNEGGITEQDFTLMNKFDALYSQIKN